MYLISDGMYLCLYYVIGYRKDVVLENLQKSFPEKTSAELERIRKDYFKFLCDITLETFKTLTMSAKTATQRCYMDAKTVDLFNYYAKKNQSVILVLGHSGNWEWGGNAFSLQCKQPLYVIYHPLENAYFNQLMNRIRSRFGTQLISMRETFKAMTRLKTTCTATAFIGDQTPPPETAHWMLFMNQATPVFKGTERMAQRFNYPTLFMSIKRIKRGVYEVSVDDLIEAPALLEEGFVTTWHTQLLEKTIRNQPETWLWSHRRWKHRAPEGLSFSKNDSMNK